MNIKIATAIVGGLSQPSKMPCFGYSIPAEACKVGGKLRLVGGSVCSSCYAHRGNYAWPNVRLALQKRLESLTHPEWVEAMVYLLFNKRGIGEYFRWHDSGDLQGMWHLANIVQVCEATPHITHWLPTKEKGLIMRWLNEREFPSNLTVRVSDPMVNQLLTPTATLTSSVTTSKSVATCRAFENDGKCGSCRKCWDRNIPNVIYLAH